MRRLIFVAVACLALGGPASASTPSSGLWGVVRRGPITPVCRVGRSCDAPAQNIVLVFSRNGVVAKRATTNRLGKYRVALAPGSYSVTVAATPARGAIGRGLTPVRVHVVASRFSHVDFLLDTGIR